MTPSLMSIDKRCDETIELPPVDLNISSRGRFVKAD
jgi:hypothetical protein